MEGRAAVLWGVGERWNVETIHVSPPVTGEVLVQWEASGLCHSDDHFVTGDFVMPEELRLQYGLPSPFPMIGGHEGAGTVLEVGPGVTSVAPADLVSASFIPDSSSSSSLSSNQRPSRRGAWAGGAENPSV